MVAVTPTSPVEPNHMEHKDEGGKGGCENGPTISLVAQTMQGNPLEMMKNVCVMIFGPILFWGSVCLLPMYEETSGFSLENYVSYSFVIMGKIAMCIPFYTINRMYYPCLTKRIWCLALIADVTWLMLVLTISMGSNGHPIPLLMMIEATTWWPILSGSIYIQLLLRGFIKTGAGAMRTFFKLNAIILSFGVYFFICSTYSMAMLSFRGRSTWQMVFNGSFNVMSYFYKKKLMAFLPSMIPSLENHGGSLPVGANSYSVPREAQAHDPRRSSIRFGVYLTFDMCKELFVSFSFSSVQQPSIAAVIIAFEVLPVALLSFKMSNGYYRALKRFFPTAMSSVNVVNYRLMLSEEFGLDLLAQGGSTMGYLMVAPIWRFGWNRMFFPLHSSCESEYYASLEFPVILLIICMVVAMGTILSVWYHYKISIRAIVEAHLRENRDLYFTLSLYVWTFPCCILWKHSNVLPLVASGLYKESTGCS